MNSLTYATRDLMRPIILAACVALLALATTQAAGANQSGSPVDAANFQQALCKFAGGTATVDVDRTVEGVRGAYVRCNGGLLDGMSCINDSLGTICDLPRRERFIHPDETPTVRPTGGIVVATNTPTPTLERTDDIVVPTDLAEEPGQDELESDTSATVEETESGSDATLEETGAGSDAPVADEPDQGQLGHPLRDEVTAPTGGVTVAEAGGGAVSGTILNAGADEEP